MKKSELIKSLSKTTDVPKVAVTAVLEQLNTIIQDELAKNGEASIYGLVKFSTQLRAARKFKNPSTGGIVDAPAKLVVKAKALAPMNRIL